MRFDYRRAAIIAVAALVAFLVCCGAARCVASASTDEPRTCAIAKPGGGGGGARGGGARGGTRSGTKPKAPPAHPDPKPVVVIPHGGDTDCD